MVDVKLPVAKVLHRDDDKPPVPLPVGTDLVLCGSEAFLAGGILVGIPRIPFTTRMYRFSQQAEH